MHERRLSICKPCEYFRPGPACAMVRRCCESDEPSPGIFALMLASPYARCRHPSGDRWNDAIEIAEPQIIDANGFSGPSAGERVIMTRLNECTRCEHYMGRHMCRHLGLIPQYASARDARCPADRWSV